MTGETLIEKKTLMAGMGRGWGDVEVVDAAMERAGVVCIGPLGSVESVGPGYGWA